MNYDSEPALAKEAARVLIVDDHPAVREGLAIRLSNLPDLEVCGEADETEEVLQLVEQQQPDVVVLDILLSNSNGIDLIRRIKARCEHARVLVWSMHDESLYAERALRAGAVGYVNKRQATRAIVDAIRSVLQGKIYLSDAMADRLLHGTGRNREGAAAASPVERLSDRELEVFQMIGRGTATSDIARQLHLSVKTVETHRQRIKSKLNLQRGTALVRYAVQWVLENG